MTSLDKNQESMDEDENIGISCTLDAFKEYDEIISMISNIPVDSLKAKLSEKRFEDFKTIVDQYQEQPHLLDPHLEGILGILVDCIRNPDSSKDGLSLAYKYLWLVVKVRGYKYIVKKMPHEVRDLLPVLKLLEDQQDVTDFHGSYVLLMWLSIILYMPFNMKKFDVSAQNAQVPEDQTVVGRIVLLMKKYLEAPHSSREIASYLASRFFTRPDLIEEHLPKFIDYCFEVLKGDEIENRLALFHKMGALRSLSQIFKNGKREELLTYAEPVLTKLLSSGMLQREDTSLQKYAIKLMQRLGLTFLRPRIASWRYQRGSRSLATNVVDGKSTNVEESAPVDDTDEDVHPFIEDVIDVLLEGIKNNDTVVRWSAAKGIGRVTSRLPRELADDVVGAILDLFNSRESHRAWHGGCLALAELARRGLFLPERLSEVLPILEKALVYDELRGQSSIGSNIRDAACYLSWAFARAYNPEQMAPYVDRLATGLLIVSLFDREIPCRRAGSAAFQEHVGRQGTFPHGIEILTAVDYFAVGNRSNAYLSLSVHVGQYKTYTIPLIDHLYERKVGHWDTGVRNLAGQALANLTKFEPLYVSQEILPGLIQSATCSSLILRHGSIIAIGHVVLALSTISKTENKPLDTYLTNDAVNSICQIVFTLGEKSLYKGMGGEYMKQATTVMIGKCAMAALPVTDRKVLDKWHEILEECLIYVDEMLRQEALEAIEPLWNQYFIKEKSWQKILIQTHIEKLDGNIENHIIGYTAGLGSMPSEFLEGTLKQVLSALIKVTQITPNTMTFAKARKESVHSIMKIVETVGINPNGCENETINCDGVKIIHECLLTALTDYTMDRRGDIGAWVREISIQALTEITKSVCVKDPHMVDSDVSQKIVGNLCQQAVERIDRTRKIAGSALQTFLYAIDLPSIPRLDELKNIFNQEWCNDCNWSSESTTFNKFVQVLDLPEYRTQTLLGLFYSLGGTSANLSRFTCAAVQTYLNDRISNHDALKDFMSSLLSLFKKHQKVDRITLPLIKSLVEILSSCNALDEIFETDEAILKELVGVLRVECSRCTDFYKLSAAVTVFCELLRIKSPSSKVILTQLSIFLGYQYPKVRAITATSLLMALQEYEYGSVHGVSPESLDDVCLVLEDTPWMDSIEEARKQRNKVCELMNIPAPIAKPKNK